MQDFEKYGVFEAQQALEKMHRQEEDELYRQIFEERQRKVRTHSALTHITLGVWWTWTRVCPLCVTVLRGIGCQTTLRQASFVVVFQIQFLF